MGRTCLILGLIQLKVGDWNLEAISDFCYNILHKKHVHPDPGISSKTVQQQGDCWRWRRYATGASIVRYEMRNTINPGILNMGHPCPLWYETPSMNK